MRRSASMLRVDGPDLLDMFDPGWVLGRQRHSPWYIISCIGVLPDGVLSGWHRFVCVGASPRWTVSFDIAAVIFIATIVYRLSKTKKFLVNRRLQFVFNSCVGKPGEGPAKASKQKKGQHGGQCVVSGGASSI